MATWFRFYNSTLDDPKAQKLSPELFKHWVNLLCLAARNDGIIPRDDIAFALRISEQEAIATVAALQLANLIDLLDGNLQPHNWNIRQYQSDTSTERVKRFRKRSSNVSCNVSVTPPETETETETETERRGTKKINLSDLRASRACQTSSKEGRHARWRQKVTAYAKSQLSADDFSAWLTLVAAGDHEALERMNDLMKNRP